MSAARTSIVALILAGLAQTPASAQGRGGGAPPSARASAPIDLTGYWVAVVNEDWRYRMVTPAKGEYGGMQITKEALQIVNNWDPAADEKAGEQCKSYGAAAVMRLPARLHITWRTTTRFVLTSMPARKRDSYASRLCPPVHRRGRATRQRNGSAVVDVAVLRPGVR